MELEATFFFPCIFHMYYSALELLVLNHGGIFSANLLQGICETSWAAVAKVAWKRKRKHEKYQFI